MISLTISANQASLLLILLKYANLKIFYCYTASILKEKVDYSCRMASTTKLKV